MALEKMRVKIKKIKTPVDSKNSYIIASAKVMKETKGKYKETSTTIDIKGCIPNVKKNDVLVISAEKVYSEGYGYGYKIDTFKKISPGSLEEIRKFMLSKKGLGPKNVDLLINKYGTGVLQAIRENSNALDGIKMSSEKKNKLRSEILFDRYFDLILGYLEANNLDQGYAMPLFLKYKVNTMTILRGDPFVPFLDGVIDFQTSDSLCFKNGIEYDDKMRISMVVYATLLEDSNSKGNVYTKRDSILPLCNDFLLIKKSPYVQTGSFSEEDITSALEFLCSKNYIRLDTDILIDNIAIYLKSNFYNENNIAEYVKVLNSGIKSTFFDRMQAAKELDNYASTKNPLSENQKKAVLTSLQSPISIITGGPGTGKTKTIQGLIDLIRIFYPASKISLTAPTGKAANRMAEVTGLNARTVHRLIGYGRFVKTAVDEELIDADFIIIDEFSMADIDLTSRFLSKVDECTRIVFVGDCDQLPSVGPGIVLNDLISSKKIPVTHLTEIFRQGAGSSIIANAHAIINHSDETKAVPLVLSNNSSNKDDFYFINKRESNEIQDTIVQSIRRFKTAYKIGLQNIQVLAPVRGGDLGVDNLNKLLQDEFNPVTSANNVYEIFDKEFRVKDKVIHVKNDYKLGVFNGETGVVKRVGGSPETALEVEFSDDKCIWYSRTELEQLELAYAITIHKSQGSEFPLVIMPIHNSFKHAMNKNLIYTGFTRAKEKVVLIGDITTLAVASVKRADDRSSTLVQKL